MSLKNKPVVFSFPTDVIWMIPQSTKERKRHDLRNIKTINKGWGNVWLLVSFPTINFMKEYSASLQTMHENAHWSLTGLQRACRAEMISITENQFPVNGEEAKILGQHQIGFSRVYFLLVFWKHSMEI